MPPSFGSVIILAGGQSRRMGFDKQQLVIGDELLPHRQIRELRESFSQIIVSTLTPELYKGLPVETVTDLYVDVGPLAGIHAGLMAARSDYVYVIACDMPEVNASYIEALKQKLSASMEVKRPDGIATLRASGRIEPFQAFYQRTLVPAIEHALLSGKNSVVDFLHNRPFLWFSEEEAKRQSEGLSIFQNINKSVDIGPLRKKVKGHVLDRDVAEQSDLLREVDILRVTRNDAFIYTDTLIDEIQLDLTVGEETMPFYLLADRMEDFVIGWLRTTKQIENRDDVLKISHRQTDHPDVWEAEVTLIGKREHPASEGIIEHGRPTLAEAIPALPFSAEWLVERFDLLDQSGKLFHLTGATHVLALYREDGERLDIVEDVSRHVAFDKLIGRATTEGIELSDCFMLTSCRLTASIVQKAAAVCIKLLASRAAVTTRAMKVAQRYNIRLIGFVRGGRMNVYP